VIMELTIHAASKAKPLCPQAPGDAQFYTDQIKQWVMWGVITTMGVSLFASIGMLVWGRMTHHPKGARLGLDGILIILGGAILYMIGPGTLASFTKIRGC
jgi:hypothetical protein